MKQESLIRDNGRNLWLLFICQLFMTRNYWSAALDGPSGITKSSLKSVYIWWFVDLKSSPTTSMKKININSFNKWK